MLINVQMQINIEIFVNLLNKVNQNELSYSGISSVSVFSDSNSY